MPQTLTVVAYAVVENDCLLTVRKRNTSKFMFPGGKLNPGESRLDAVVREVQEELSCQVDLATVDFLGEFVTEAANEANTQLVANVYSGALIGKPVPSNEIEELLWLSSPSRYPLTQLAPLITDCVWPRLFDRPLA
ncbi:MAG: NUDIX domain-containing protein [Cyanobacteria bacterium J06635_1]